MCGDPYDEDKGTVYRGNSNKKVMNPCYEKGGYGYCRYYCQGDCVLPPECYKNQSCFESNNGGCVDSDRCSISPNCKWWIDGKCRKDYLPTEEEIANDAQQSLSDKIKEVLVGHCSGFYHCHNGSYDEMKDILEGEVKSVDQQSLAVREKENPCNGIQIPHIALTYAEQQIKKLKAKIAKANKILDEYPKYECFDHVSLKFAEDMPRTKAWLDKMREALK